MKAQVGMLLLRSVRLLAAIVLTPLMTALLYLAAMWRFSGYLRNADGSLNQPHWDKFQDDLGGAPVFYVVLVAFCFLVVLTAVVLRRRDVRSVTLIGAGLGALAFAAMFVALPARPFSDWVLSLAFLVALGAAEALALAVAAGLTWRSVPNAERVV